MYQDLIKMMPRDQVLIHEPMSKHTTFKIGGPADLLLTPINIEGIRKIITWCQNREIPYYVIGHGSNLLVLDDGIRGVVIELGRRFKGVEFFGDLVYSLAGTRMSELCKQVALESLSGLEFAEGIPGSVGGAIAMNAGAYGGEIKDVLASVMAMDEKGQEIVYRVEQLDLSYRHSIFSENHDTILGAYFRLHAGESPEIFARMGDYARERREKQPLDRPSAGSIFKRPEGYYVGTMIEEAGLKGYHIGDAQISTQHAGFIVNLGHATARDVLDLIDHIRNVILTAYGVELETELRILGDH